MPNFSVLVSHYIYNDIYNDICIYTHIYMDKIYVLSRKYAAMQSDKETFIEEDTRYKNHST